jgi:voltage-gated sodium channel
MAGEPKGEKSQVIDEAEWRELEEAYGLHGNDPKENATVPVSERPAFELFIGLAVVLNAIVMALELDLSEKDASQSEKMPWIVVDMFFCTIFACEILFRVYCTSLREFLSATRAWGDCLLVALNIADTSIQLSGSESTGLQSFSALRILRLFKMMKIFRIVSHVKELSLIATGLVSALKSLQYVSLLLGLVIFVMAVMFRILVGRECQSDQFRQSFAYHFGDGIDPGDKCEEYWGTVLRAMYTLYQVTTLESWSQVIARPIWDIHPYYMILLLGFQLVTTFGLLNIVVAAVVDGTMNSSDELVVENQTQKEIQSHLSSLRDIFLEAADPSSGRVVADRLIPILRSPSTRRKLLLLEISYDDPSQIFRILDSKEEKAISIADFVTGFMRMRGTSKSKDLLGIRAQIYRAERNLASKIEQVHSATAANSSGSGGAGGGNADILDLGGKLDTFAATSKKGMGKLSEELQKHVGSLSDEFRGRMESLEGQIGRLGSTKMLRDDRWDSVSLVARPALAVSPSAPLLLSLAGPSAGGSEQQPSWPPPAQSDKGAVWQKICCTPAAGRWDRESVKQRMSELVRPTLPTIQETPQLHAILTREHESLMWQLDEKHKILLNRLSNATLGKSSMPRLPDESSLPTKSPDGEDQGAVSERVESAMKLEQKQKAPVSSVNVTCAFVQTDPTDNATALDASRSENDRAELVAQAAPSGANAPEDDLNDPRQAVRKLARRDSNAPDVMASAQFPAVKGKGKGPDPELTGFQKVEAFVTGPIFETIFAALITLNALVMAAETQYWGIDTGFKIGFYGSHKPARETWHGAEDVFLVLEYTFGVVFVFELFLKISVLRLNFIWSWWNWLDSIIVGAWVMDSVFHVHTFLNPMMLRLFRLVKLLRVAKLFRTFQAFDSLSLLIHSLKASASILFWSIVVIFVMQIVAALFFSQMLQDHITNGPARGREEVYELFGTFSRSFVTMLELTIGQWGPICRTLVENVSEWYAIFVVMYVLLVSFATIKVISAVFILETQKLASTDEEILIMNKDRQNQRLDANIAAVFSEIDTDETGTVNWEEFEGVLADHRVVTWLAALDLEVQHCEGLFSLMDDGDGKISCKEFMQGVRRLKGTAKSVDLVNVASKVTEMAKCIHKIEDVVKSKESKLSLPGERPETESSS